MTKRRTAKVLADPAVPLSVTDNLSRDQMDLWIKAAGNSPFHKPCDSSHFGKTNAFEPWRVVKFDTRACRELLETFIKNDVDAGKINEMLAAADGLMLVTWTPNPPKTELLDGQDFEASFDNMEHIAAASAFCQSALLAAEEDGWRTYWSSGGMLRKQVTFDLFGIPNDQILIGALFFFPSAAQSGNADTKPGSLAKKRSDQIQWARWAIQR